MSLSITLICHCLNFQDHERNTSFPNAFLPEKRKRSRRNRHDNSGYKNNGGHNNHSHHNRNYIKIALERMYIQFYLALYFHDDTSIPQAYFIPPDFLLASKSPSTHQKIYLANEAVVVPEQLL